MFSDEGEKPAPGEPGDLQEPDRAAWATIAAVAVVVLLTSFGVLGVDEAIRILLGLFGLVLAYSMLRARV